MFIALILVVFGFYMIVKAARMPNKPTQNKNPYIRYHDQKIDDDKHYNEYLKWCHEKGQLALDKQGFDKIRQKEKAMYNSLDNFGFKEK